MHVPSLHHMSAPTTHGVLRDKTSSHATLEGRIWTWIRQEEATGVLDLPEDVPGSKVHVSIGVSTDPLLHSNHTGQPCILLSTRQSKDRNNVFAPASTEIKPYRNASIEHITEHKKNVIGQRTPSSSHSFPQNSVRERNQAVRR
jgi:hypothetical protein